MKCSHYKIKNAIEGVSLNLIEAEPNVDFTLDLRIDTTATKNKILDFVHSYNSALSMINDVSGYQSNGFEGTAGVLIGDATVRSIQSALRKEINTAVSVTNPFGLKVLSQIGITTNSKTGELQVDSGKLQKSLDESFDDVGHLFANNQDGLASRVDKALSVFTQTGGLLYSKIIGMNESIIDIKTQRVDLESRLQKLEQRLIAQFTMMDSIVSKLNNTADYLKRAVDGLPEPNLTRK